MMTTYKTIAESNNFIVLDKYNKYSELNEAPSVYQTEAALEREFIQDLQNQGYENPSNLTTIEAMLANVRIQLQTLNDMVNGLAMWKSIWISPVITLLKKPEKFTIIISTTLCSTMDISKTSTWLIKRILLAIKCR